MSVVWLAEDLKHRRPVALKVLRSELTALLGHDRFLREIEFTARLAHPHVLPLLDSGEAAGQLYYTSPFVEGDSLRSRLAREKQLPLDDALRLTREIAGALDYAHRRGVIHRDLKPENILLQEGHAVVADFGIARAIEEAGGERFTRTGSILGTPTYMSPEQAAGQGDLDARSDVYALGCVLFEMLAGTPPFVGPTTEAIVYQHTSSPPPSLTERRASVPADVAQAVQRALAKTAADRFGSAGELAASLEATKPTARPTPPVVTTRRWLPIAIAAVVLVTASIVASVWVRDGRPPWRHPLPTTEKSWVMVAELGAAVADRAAADGTRDLIMAALDQSDIVSCVSQEQIQGALKNAGKPANTRIDDATARELAYRTAVRSVIQGRVGRVGASYSIVLTVVDVEDGHTILTVSEVAREEKDLVPAVGRLSRHLRSRLGEQAGAIRTTRPLVDAATPSFEAYRKFLEARRVAWEGSSQKVALSIIREALALDPDFARAWGFLGTSFQNLGFQDSALAAYDEALKRPHRLTDSQRLYTEACRASLKGDFNGARIALDRVLTASPPLSQAALAHNQLAGVLWSLNRKEEALQHYSRAIELAPFQVPTGVLYNRTQLLAVMGRFDAARADAERLTGNFHQDALTNIAIYERAWDRLDSLATAIVANEERDERDRATACLCAAAAVVARGRVGDGLAWLRRGRAVLRGAKCLRLIRQSRGQAA